MDYDGEGFGDGETEDNSSVIKITGQYSAGDIDNAVVHRVADVVIKRLDSVKDRIDAAVEQEVDSRMAKLVDKVFDEIVQPTDSYGKPTGPALSLRDAMIEKAEKYLDARVNDKGRPVDACAYVTKYTRAEWLMKKVSEEVWDYSMERRLKDAVTEIRDEIYNQAAVKFAKKIKELIG